MVPAHASHAGTRSPPRTLHQHPSSAGGAADRSVTTRAVRMVPSSAAATATSGLVLWLHGSAETGEQNIAAPRSPHTSPTPPPSASPLTPPPSPATTTVRDEEGILEAVEHVHEMLDKEVAARTCPTNIFVCGLSQGGALAIASVLLYHKSLGGCVVFSGSVPLSKSIADRVTPEARKMPVLWFHGMADRLVLFEAGHAECAFLQGMAWEFKTCPTLGHSLVDEELQCFRRWIFDRLGICRGAEVASP